MSLILGFIEGKRNLFIDLMKGPGIRNVRRNANGLEEPFGIIPETESLNPDRGCLETLCTYERLQVNMQPYNRSKRCAGALIVIAAAALAFALFSADPSDAEGQPCGDGVVWSYADGTLAISYTGTGTGAMDDFQYMASDVPWSQHRLEITKITIGDGVTAVGEWSFGVLNNLASVTVADSVKSIGAD